MKVQRRKRETRKENMTIQTKRKQQSQLKKTAEGVDIDDIDEWLGKKDKKDNKKKKGAGKNVALKKE